MKSLRAVSAACISILILSGCSVDWNDEKDEKIAELEKRAVELKQEKENDTFKKKQECLKYETDIRNRLNGQNEKFVELFYSPIKNSCLYVADRHFQDTCGEFHAERIIYDYLSTYG